MSVISGATTRRSINSYPLFHVELFLTHTTVHSAISADLVKDLGLTLTIVPNAIPALVHPYMIITFV